MSDDCGEPLDDASGVPADRDMDDMLAEFVVLDLRGKLVGPAISEAHKAHESPVAPHLLEFAGLLAILEVQGVLVALEEFVACDPPAIPGVFDLPLVSFEVAELLVSEDLDVLELDGPRRAGTAEAVDLLEVLDVEVALHRWMALDPLAVLEMLAVLERLEMLEVFESFV